MEINLENAFYVAIKLSLSPFVTVIDQATLKIQDIAQQQANKILEKPLLSTLMGCGILIVLLIVITLSIIITTGVVCIVIVILIIEGFILGVIIVLALVIAALILAIVMIFVSLVDSHSKI